MPIKSLPPIPKYHQYLGPIVLVVLPTIIYISLIVAGIGFSSEKSWTVPLLAARCIALLLVAARGVEDAGNNRGRTVTAE
jgi:hypothetical protein